VLPPHNARRAEAAGGRAVGTDLIRLCGGAAGTRSRTVRLGKWWLIDE
jgi:hypothetical protein